MGAPETWLLTHEGSTHEVVISDAGLGRSVSWLRDGVEVAHRRTTESRLVLGDDTAGAVRLRLPELVGPARRVTYYPPEPGLGALASAHAGLGGIDLDPEAGSAAARREAWIRAHPHQYAVRRAVSAALGVLVPILLLWRAARLVLPAIPWPEWHLPDIPWPDLPDIPWPDWHWPDLIPDWTLPGWVREVLDKAKYVGPVLLAVILARAEVKRRRAQDEAKRQPSGDESP